MNRTCEMRLSPLCPTRSIGVTRFELGQLEEPLCWRGRHLAAYFENRTLDGRFSPCLGLKQELQKLGFCLRPSHTQGGKMLNDLILTTSLCLTLVGAMALFYGEMKLLKNSH